MAQREDFEVNTTIAKKGKEINSESFQRFLAWLDVEPELAGKRYHEIHTKLIKIFQYRGCHKAEELADETINRVIRRVDEISNEYVGDPALYFYGVANYVYQEYLKHQRVEAIPIPEDQRASNPLIEEETEKEERMECLDKCLLKLTVEERELILEYYKEEKQEKIDKRKGLSEKQQVSLVTLRKRTQRIRQKLKDCISNCLKK
jgi:RNA polymerase sigma factor (sigma-70 family)